jgi:hypothetical protein
LVAARRHGLRESQKALISAMRSETKIFTTKPGFLSLTAWVGPHLHWIVTLACAAYNLVRGMLSPFVVTTSAGMAEEISR